MSAKNVVEQVTGSPRVQGSDIIEYVLGEDRFSQLLEIIVKRSLELGEKPENVKWFRTAVLDPVIFVTFSREAKMSYLTPRMILGLKHMYSGYIGKIIAACVARGARVLAELLTLHKNALEILFIETRMRGLYGRTQERLLQQMSVIRQETQVNRSEGGGLVAAISRLLRGG